MVKYVVLIHKIPESKAMMQSSSSDVSVCHNGADILNVFDSKF